MEACSAIIRDNIWTRPGAIALLRAELEAKSPAEALKALKGLELSYRLADPSLKRLSELNALINDQIYRAFQAYRQDPGSVPLHPLYEAVTDTLTRRPERRFLGRPFDWHVTLLETWHTQFPLSTIRHLSKTLSRSHTPELKPRIAPILHHLLRADLYPWEANNQSTYKSELRHLLSLLQSEKI